MIKKNLLWSLLLVGLAAVSCEENKIDAYGGENGIYFNKRIAVGNVLQDSTYETFAYVEAGNDIEIRIPVQSVGRVANVDREVLIEVTSDNATEGVDYLLPDKCVLPAGKAVFNYVVTLKRSEVILTQYKAIDFEIKANDNFTPVIKTETNAAGKMITTLKHTIKFSEMFDKAPAAWDEDPYTPATFFTPKKLELASQVMGIPKSEFNDPGKMNFTRFQFVLVEMQNYVMGRAMVGDIDDSILNENGLLLFVEA